ncbi:alpha/Beta hydrolase fold protein [Artemisia annua]|uniref:Alpha/Beta hydrolase fold protein n=1 Tax=Artemisia annua TaxID=35608 RepID=A0A2U1NWB6_ARTAN|nr:alpha/Beta hydrolase fold protein [Artemisia annua]
MGEVALGRPIGQRRFSSEVELGKFLGSINIIADAYGAISKTMSTYELHTSPSGIQILAFNCPTDYTTRFLNGEFCLVSSENHKVVDFISTGRLIKSPLVVTGRGFAGYCAILFTLWLQHIIDVEESNDHWDFKRPVCITFGSPLIGNEALQGAISKYYPQWESRFLNVVAKKDRLASFFSSNSKYKPFGTFLISTESGRHAAFEDQDAVLAVLDTMASSRGGNVELLVHDYGNILSSMKREVMYRGISECGEFSLNLLREGITLQLREAGVLDNISNDLIGRMMQKQADKIRKKKNVYEPTKKLNDMKINMVCLEFYMKINLSNGGYYDSYKNPRGRDGIQLKIKLINYQEDLNKYWKSFLNETERNPQKEDAKMRKRWLLNGHNYRRMVEPLDIAKYYSTKGNRNYIANRSYHYIELEKLLAKDQKDLSGGNGNKKAASLTKDSCFWARVEEATLALGDLKKEGSSNSVYTEQLEQFEDYMMNAIQDFSLSPDVFLKGSSLMVWWSEYKTYKGSSYASKFAEYMNNEWYMSYQ